MDQVRRIVRRLAARVGSPLASQVIKHLDAADWTNLQQIRVEPSCYGDAESLWRDNLIVDLLRKCDLPSSVDKEKAAIDSFWACEAQCCESNHRLWLYLPENDLYWPSHKQAHVHEFIVNMRKDIARALGKLPLQLTPRFSGGATMSDKGFKTTIPDKMTSTPTFYSGTQCLLPFLYDSSWGRALKEMEVVPTVVRGNSFFTVPKDAFKHRGCCKEASVNVSLQLDAAQGLRRGLERWGIDLRTAEETHRRLARESSVTQEFATIDMSNASDTVSRVVVRCLLPEAWHTLLDSLRATHTRVGKRWVLLEKFSSMGNGFTFELETIIFAAIGREAHRLLGLDPDLVKAYGDDLIVDTKAASLVMAVLEWLGFTPNMNKTFVEGRFRESCGGDYFDGIPVRGFYIKELPDKPADWIVICNGLRRTCGDDPERWSLVLPAWLMALEQIPGDIRRCRGPVHLGDIVIHDDEARWQKRFDKNQTCRVMTWTPMGYRYSLQRWAPAVQLASCTLVSGEEISPRGKVKGYRRRWVPAYLTSHWLPDTGSGSH